MAEKNKNQPLPNFTSQPLSPLLPLLLTNQGQKLSLPCGHRTKGQSKAKVVMTVKQGKSKIYTRLAVLQLNLKHKRKDYINTNDFYVFLFIYKISYFSLTGTAGFEPTTLFKVLVFKTSAINQTRPNTPFFLLSFLFNYSFF